MIQTKRKNLTDLVSVENIPAQKQAEVLKALARIQAIKPAYYKRLRDSYAERGGLIVTQYFINDYAIYQKDRPQNPLLVFQ